MAQTGLTSKYKDDFVLLRRYRRRILWLVWLRTDYLGDVGVSRGWGGERGCCHDEHYQWWRWWGYWAPGHSDLRYLEFFTSIFLCSFLRIFCVLIVSIFEWLNYYKTHVIVMIMVFLSYNSRIQSTSDFDNKWITIFKRRNLLCSILLFIINHYSNYYKSNLVDRNMWHVLLLYWWYWWLVLVVCSEEHHHPGKGRQD